MADPLREIPGWCSWTPFSDYMRACQPYSQAELRAEQERQLEKIARVNPALAAEGLERGDAAVAAFRRSHPEEDEEYLQAMNRNTDLVFVAIGIAALSLVLLLKR